MTELVLVPIALLDSRLAAVMGIGCGILLITLMPGLLQAAATIPVHAAVELAGNFSRARSTCLSSRRSHWGCWRAPGWAGTRLWQLVTQVDFQRWFRLLAARMIALPLRSLPRWCTPGNICCRIAPRR